jgi:predicted transcriptional regulator
MTHSSSKRNLQNRKESKSENENKSNHIPTTVQGLTNVNPTSKTKTDDEVQTQKLLNELQETINLHYKEGCSDPKKHKVILTGDSNIRGYMYDLKPYLITIMNYTVLSNIGLPPIS